MKYFAAALLLFSALLPAFVHADMIPEDYHVVQNCIALDNASDFPDYDFKLVGQAHIGADTDVLLTETVQCDPGVVGEARFLAIKKTEEENVVSAYDERNPEGGDSWWTVDANQDFITWSDLQVSFHESLSDTDSTVKVTQILHIDSLNDAVLLAHVAKTVNEDASGQKETVKHPAPDTPSAEQTMSDDAVKSTGSDMDADDMNVNDFPVIPVVVVLVCIGGIGLAASMTTWKK